MKRSKQCLVDICSVCSHQCVYCHHQRFHKHKPAFMSAALFNQVADILQKEGYRTVHLYRAGDPLMHPDLYRFLVRLARSRMDVHVASKMARKPLDVGGLIDVLIQFHEHERQLVWHVDVPALNQETAQRVAGCIDLAVQHANLKQLAELQRNFKAALSVGVTTIATRHNESQLGALRRQMRLMGLRWCVKPMGYYKLHELSPAQLEAVTLDYPKKPLLRVRVDRKPAGSCKFILNPCIGPTGDVTICCHDMQEQHVAGNIATAGSLQAILDSAAYKTLYAQGLKRKLPICKGCN